MNGTEYPEQRVTAGEGDGLGPREAARLLEQTRLRARREFDLRPPAVMAVAAGVILAGYGALWLSTRGQHPYQGPSAGAIVAVYAAVVVSIALGVRVHRRASTGVSGPGVRQRRLEGAAIVVSFLGSPVLQGALKHYGASHAIVYGVIPAAAPLIVVGTTVMGVAASNSDWPQFGGALMVVITGVVAAFAGPSGAWLAAGIGLFAAVVGYGLVSARQRQLAGRI